VPLPEHCGLLAEYSEAMRSWVCPACRRLVLTDEDAYRAC
jgi:hypothetical protein